MNSSYQKHPKLIRAFLHSFDGLRHAAKNEFAVRLELAVLAIAIPVALIVGNSPFAKAALISSVLLVLIIELLNTAIEAAVDRVSTEFHELSKIAKDVGSAAVLVALINAAVVWCVIIID